MKEETKMCKKERANGITLIALIITIIIMLILVGVTISVALNGGLIGKAQEARRGTSIGMVKDMVYTDAGAKQAEKGGEKIGRSQLKGILEKYFTDVPDILGMTEEELGEVKLTLKEEYGGYKDIPLTDIYGGVLSTNQEFLATTVLKNDTRSSNSTKKSPYVKYNNMLWRVLYDIDSGYGIQLVVDDSETRNGKVESVTLGVDDPELIRYNPDAESLSSTDKAVLSYNNAVDRLNKESEKYIIGGTNDVVDKSRAFGSDPSFAVEPDPPVYHWFRENRLRKMGRCIKG